MLPQEGDTTRSRAKQQEHDEERREARETYHRPRKGSVQAYLKDRPGREDRRGGAGSSRETAIPSEARLPVPRPPVGSRVRHAVRGEGTVTEHMADGRTRVEFDSGDAHQHFYECA